MLARRQAGSGEKISHPLPPTGHRMAAKKSAPLPPPPAPPNHHLVTYARNVIWITHGPDSAP
jgi:hypothetical protein